MSESVTQKQLQMSYRLMAALSKECLPSVFDVGFKVFSQTDEDGILLYLFSLIGSGNRTCVELGCGNGIECNTANLIVNHGWTGIMVGGNNALVQNGREFYKGNLNTYVYPPRFVHSWVTRENVNDLVASFHLPSNFDLLSIDIDGMDYWIWKAITCARPRVVVIEFNHLFGPERGVTIPYDPMFNAYNPKYPKTNGQVNYYGASLAAMVKLAQSRRYRLVACNHLCFNAFFVDEQFDVPAVDPSRYFQHPRVKWGIETRFPLISKLPVVEV